MSGEVFDIGCHLRSPKSCWKSSLQVIESTSSLPRKLGSYEEVGYNGGTRVSLYSLQLFNRFYVNFHACSRSRKNLGESLEPGSADSEAYDNGLEWARGLSYCLTHRRPGFSPQASRPTYEALSIAGCFLLKQTESRFTYVSVSLGGPHEPLLWTLEPW